MRLRVRKVNCVTNLNISILSTVVLAYFLHLAAVEPQDILVYILLYYGLLYTDCNFFYKQSVTK